MWEGSTEGQALPVLQLLQLLSMHWLVLCLRSQSVPAPKVLPTVEYKCFQKLNNSRKTHIMQTSSLFPDDTTWSTKHKQKWTKQSTKVFWKNTHLVKGFSALFTAIRTVIMLNWLVSHKNWIETQKRQLRARRQTAKISETTDGKQKCKI